MTALSLLLWVLLAPLGSAVLITLFLAKRGSAAAAVSTLASAIIEGGALLLAFEGGRVHPGWEWL
ncbi:MAG TPA: NADH-quinone oxidoreductase subunit L, partial [Opitutaceae bacterium]